MESWRCTWLLHVRHVLGCPERVCLIAEVVARMRVHLPGFGVTHEDVMLGSASGLVGSQASDDPEQACLAQHERRAISIAIMLAAV